MPEFARCVASNVTESFVGRALGPDDAALIDRLAAALRDGGYRPRALVRALVRAEVYRDANNLAPAVWREEGATP